MKKFNLIFLLIAFVNADKCYADLGYDFCMFKVQELKEPLKFPVIIDDITSLEDITCAEGIPSKFQYHYVVKGDFSGENKVNLDSFMQNDLSKKLNQTWCDKKSSYYEMVRYMDIVFIYRDLNNHLITQHKINLKKCSEI